MQPNVYTRTFDAHAVKVLEFSLSFSLFASMISMVLNYLFELISHSFFLQYTEKYGIPAPMHYSFYMHDLSECGMSIETKFGFCVFFSIDL